MRHILSKSILCLGASCLLAMPSFAHHENYYSAPQTAYRVGYESYCPPVRKVIKYNREGMVYKNPHPSKIFNHPATGMKHKDTAEQVQVTAGTPRAYQQLGASLFYGPYFYTPRDRDARPEWRVPN